MEIKLSNRLQILSSATLPTTNVKVISINSIEILEILKLYLFLSSFSNRINDLQGFTISWPSDQISAKNWSGCWGYTKRGPIEWFGWIEMHCRWLSQAIDLMDSCHGRLLTGWRTLLQRHRVENQSSASTRSWNLLLHRWQWHWEASQAFRQLRSGIRTKNLGSTTTRCTGPWLRHRIGM